MSLALLTGIAPRVRSVNAPLEVHTEYPAFSTLCVLCTLRACHKAQFLPAPGASRLPAPRQHIGDADIARHYPEHWLLGASYSGVACGWFPAPARSGESARRVSPFRVSLWRGGRLLLYAGFSMGCTRIALGISAPESLPFWAGLLTSVDRLSLTTPHHSFTCFGRSHLLGGDGFAWFKTYRRYFSLLTFDNQWLARGQVAVTPASEHRSCTHVNTQLLRFLMLSEHPTFPLIPRISSGFERTGRTKRLDPTSPSVGLQRHTFRHCG